MFGNFDVSLFRQHRRRETHKNNGYSENPTNFSGTTKDSRKTNKPQCHDKTVGEYTGNRTFFKFCVEANRSTS